MSKTGTSSEDSRKKKSSISKYEDVRVRCMNFTAGERENEIEANGFTIDTFAIEKGDFIVVKLVNNELEYDKIPYNKSTKNNETKKKASNKEQTVKTTKKASSTTRKTTKKESEGGER